MTMNNNNNNNNSDRTILSLLVALAVIIAIVRPVTATTPALVRGGFRAIHFGVANRNVTTERSDGNDDERARTRGDLTGLPTEEDEKSFGFLDEMDGARGHIHKKYKKYMLPLLLAYKLKFFTLIPLMMGGLVLLAGSTGLAGFFFALFAATMGLKVGGH